MCHLTEYTLSAPPFPMKGTFCKVKCAYKYYIRGHEARACTSFCSMKLIGIGLEPRWLGLESSPLTIRPPHITLGHYACWKYTSIHELPYPSIEGGDMKTAQYVIYQ